MNGTANTILSFVAFQGLWLGLALLVAALAGLVWLGRGHRWGLTVVTLSQEERQRSSISPPTTPTS